jgi:hypothetical protein
VTDRKYLDKIWIRSVSVLFATITRVSEAIARDEAPRSFQVMMEWLISRGQSSGRVDDNVESIRKRFRCSRQRRPRQRASSHVRAECSQRRACLYSNCSSAAAATRVHGDTRVQADCTQSPDPTSTSALTDAQLVQLSKMALCPQSILRFAAMRCAVNLSASEIKHEVRGSKNSPLFGRAPPRES